MILLDTDHLTVLSYPEGSRSAILVGRMQTAVRETFGTTVVSVEEQLRGWLAEINRWRQLHKQIPAYERLAMVLDFLSDWEISPFDQRAAPQCEQLRKQRLRIGTQDLKIASIALVQNALLLSANIRDFCLVPGPKKPGLKSTA
jgi:tRNA(fMet)-specific endonuclease VapC